MTVTVTHTQATVVSDSQITVATVGTQGPAGAGGASGGTTLQALVKASNADHDTAWATVDKTFVGLGSVTNALQLVAANNLSDLVSASTARTNLGLGTAATQNLSAFLQPGNNLTDLVSAPAARTNLGLGSLATLSTVTLTSNVAGILPIANGGTNAGSLTSGKLNYFDGTRIGSASALTYDAANGRLGVGTPNPQVGIDIAGAAGGPVFLLYGHGGTHGYQSGMGVNLGQTPSSMGFFVGPSASFAVDAGTGGGSAAFPYPGYVTRFTIDPAGYVGINKPTAIGAQLHAVASATGTTGLIVQGTASHTANLTEWQDSSGTVRASISPDGRYARGMPLGTNNLAVYGGTSGRSLTYDANANLTLTAPEGQSGEIRMGAAYSRKGFYSDTTLSFTAEAGMSFHQGVGAELINAASSTGLTLANFAAAASPLKVRAAASQSGNLTEWQNGSGTAVATVGPTGGVGCGELTVNGGAANLITPGFNSWWQLENSYPGVPTLKIQNVNSGAVALAATNTGVVLGQSGTQIGFYGATPAARPTAIADADGSLADVTTKFNSLLGKLETIGLLAA